MEITTKKIAELNPAPYNPRQISDEALAGLTTSMKEFGCVQPIIWNKLGRQEIRNRLCYGSRPCRSCIGD